MRMSTGLGTCHQDIFMQPDIWSFVLSSQYITNYVNRQSFLRSFASIPRANTRPGRASFSDK